MLGQFFRCILSSFFLFAALSAQDLLKSSDIHTVMLEILNQHVSKKALTEKMVQTSVVNYIDQFDPERTYLLENEVYPFLHLNPSQLKAAISQYNRGEFPLFRQLNQVIQLSIKRSRKIREELESKSKHELFQSKGTKITEYDTFAKTNEELQERLSQNLYAFIEAKKLRFGVAMSAQMKEKVLYAYEVSLREKENQYLYENNKGESLPPQEQENLFSIHVLKALTSSLDSHTSFYKESEAYDLRMRLQKEFQGIGVVFKDNRQGIKVMSILNGSPAAKSGMIKEGDLLVAVDGVPVVNMPFEKAIEKLHGNKDTTVSLTLQREGKEYGVKLNREMIILKNDRVEISSQPFGNGIIGKITLHAFYQGDGISAEKDVRDAIKELEKKGNLRGLILDLRDNSGGFLTQAVKVAGLFITNGVIVISKYSNGEERFYRDVDGQVSFDGPLIILTSKVTASAAEIVAQALQDYGVALIVGDEHTYGKGTIQTQTVTDNQSTSYFKVTVGKYYTVSGHTPQKEGVKADIVVPGRWSRELVGEMGPDVIEGGVIPSVFEDDFVDISPEMRSWYLKYYTPTVQQRVGIWRQLLPKLKKNSEARIAKNQNYQFFLKGGKAIVDQAEDEEWGETAVSKKTTFGEDDLQVEEAYNILKDMVLLQDLEKKK